MKKLFSRFSQREKLIFILTASLVMGVIVYIFILEPAYKKWSELRLEYEAANLKLLKNTKLLANKELLEKEHERYKEYLQKGEDKEEQISSVLKEIESNAISCGVKVTSIKPKGEKQFKGYRQYSIEVISEADINQFIKFIYTIENSKNLLKVERLVLSLKGAQSDLLKGTLVIRKISF